MAARDKIHHNVKNALIKDGWTITHDPYTVEYGTDKVYADLAAERVIAAVKGNEKILVAIKSFIDPSIIQDFKEAYGQYMLYLDALEDMTLFIKCFKNVPLSCYPYNVKPSP